MKMTTMMIIKKEKNRVDRPVQRAHRTTVAPSREIPTTPDVVHVTSRILREVVSVVRHILVTLMRLDHLLQPDRVLNITIPMSRLLELPAMGTLSNSL